MSGIVLVSVVSSILVTGCAIKRDHYDVPVSLLSHKYQQAELFPKAENLVPPAGEKAAPTKTIAEADLDEWWRSFGSAELNALVDQALANNTDLRIAMLRLAQSQARSNQAEAGQYPVITGPIEAHHDAPPNGVNSAQISSPTQAKQREYYQAGLRGDWRVDLWGELSSLAESAELQLWQATYKSDDVHRTLIAKVVSQYIEYLSLNDRIRVARETEVVLHGMLQAVSDRVEAGDATVIDLEQQRSADFAVHATIPGLELKREMAAHALALLLGVTPSALTLSDNGMDSLTFPGVLPDVPTSLLLRRPDIRAVEARLLAADADIDVARARLFPPLNLTAQGSYGLLAYGQFFGPYGLIYNALGSLTTTIFDHGKRTQDVAFARSVHEELVETYVYTVYSAVRETEDAIVSTHMNSRRLEAQKVATDAALRAWSASRESYDVGGIDFLTLIDTERTYHRALDEYHHIRQERFNGLVSLYSALGGGVSQGGALPGEGARPQGKSAKAPEAAVTAIPGIDWTGRKIDTDEEFWLVELSGLQDRSGVTHVWRDLHQRFPSLMAERIALPRLQGKVAKEKQERATWYRVFIARFPNQEEAGTFCGQLSAKQVRCNIVSSNADEFSNFMEDEVANNAVSAEDNATAKPVLSEPVKSGDKAAAISTQASDVDANKANVSSEGAPTR
ncbi:MAG: efflux transporter outer membrane subunit [Methylobacter sp.]